MIGAPEIALSWVQVFPNPGKGRTRKVRLWAEGKSRRLTTPRLCCGSRSRQADQHNHGGIGMRQHWLAYDGLESLGESG
jgi:hypothetical protein